MKYVSVIVAFAALRERRGSRAPENQVLRQIRT
jgi:hypothetical protein